MVVCIAHLVISTLPTWLFALASSNSSARRLRSARLTAAPTLDTNGPVAVETDGESAGVLPASFQIYPDAINLRV